MEKNVVTFFPDGKQRQVVCAAVRHKNGAMLVGPRHYDGVMMAHARCFNFAFEERESICGFLDQEGTFMDRHEAFIVASAAGQIQEPDDSGGKLFSEMLY